MSSDPIIQRHEDLVSIRAVADRALMVLITQAGGTRNRNHE